MHDALREDALHRAMRCAQRTLCSALSSARCDARCDHARCHARCHHARCGAAGCSKTSLARAAAGAATASFYYLSGATLYSPYVGEAERRLREFFALGRATSPAILFIDELEAIVGSREAAGGGDEVQQRVLSTLLNEMDGVAALSQVLLIGATNRPDLLDAALLRPGRFDEQLLVPPPDEEGRAQVLGVHTRHMPLADDVGLEGLAARSVGWSGAQLAGLCREAGMEALRDDMGAAAVRQAHFEAALRRVHAVPGGSTV